MTPDAAEGLIRDIHQLSGDDTLELTAFHNRGRTLTTIHWKQNGVGHYEEGYSLGTALRRAHRHASRLAKPRMRWYEVTTGDLYVDDEWVRGRTVVQAQNGDKAEAMALRSGEPYFTEWAKRGRAHGVSPFRGLSTRRVAPDAATMAG